MRPDRRAMPVVGSVMRLSTLSNVLLPAPLRPKRPTISPRGMSKLTSFSAQISSLAGRLKGLRMRWTIASTMVECCSLCSMWQDFPKPRAEMAISSDDIGKLAFTASEEDQSDPHDQQGHHEGIPQIKEVGFADAQKRPADRIQRRRHRIEQIIGPDPRRNGGNRIADRAGIHHQL